MHDIVRWVILGLLFAGLFGCWLWSKRQARLANPGGRNAPNPLKIAQKRWIDKGTGVCLVEAQGQSYLLAYTANGGVSWQPLAPKSSAAKPAPAAPRFEDLPLEWETR